ncbi:MAG: glycosyltransferase family 1 protein [Lachnospiraceae bacterium]|nr:glycosyltransferase family 1 protein [Lachnospiraceae bacterium]
MIRKLVLFTKGIETLGFFSEQMGKAFQKLGYEVFYFDQCAEYDSFSKLLWFCEPKVTAVVSFNFDGCRGEDYMIDAKGVNFFEARQIPLINIVVDHPFYYHKFRPYLPEDYAQISIDREHEAYLKRFFPEIKRGPFLPLAGTSLWKPDTLPGWEERPLEVVFTGNYTPPSDFEHTLTRINDEYTEFYYGIIQDFIEHPHMGMSTGIIKHLEREVEDINEEGIKECMPNMIMIDLYVRNYFRGEVVKSLVEAGVTVTCYGAGWEKLACRNPENLIKGKSLDSLGCLQQISRAKISLNVLPWFKEGAHDRVFNSMLNGAVCVTDWSHYLQEELKEGEEILFYELDNREALAEQIRSLLADRERWERLSCQGYKSAAAGHTWADRARRIHEEILCKIP